MKLVVSLLLILSSLSAFAKTSAEERAELDYEIGLQSGLDYKLYTTQLSFSKFLEQDSLVGIKIGSGRDDEETQFNATLQFKYFASNTFYIAPEIFYLNLQDPWSYGKDDKFTAMGIQFRIGNQWQWKHFSLGVDWFGIGSALVFFNHQSDFYHEDHITFTALNAYVTYSF